MNSKCLAHIAIAFFVIWIATWFGGRWGPALISFSFGVVTCKDRVPTEEEVVNFADTLMYQAKADGSGIVYRSL